MTDATDQVACGDDLERMLRFLLRGEWPTNNARFARVPIESTRKVVGSRWMVVKSRGQKDFARGEVPPAFDRCDEPGARDIARARPDPCQSGARPRNALSERDPPLRHRTELDAVACARPRSAAVSRTHLPFYLVKKAPPTIRAAANWRTWPGRSRRSAGQGASGAPFTRFAPGFGYLDSACPIGVRRGRKRREAAPGGADEVLTRPGRSFWILRREQPPFRKQRGDEGKSPHITSVLRQIAMK
jgi:hypothetical protein